MPPLDEANAVGRRDLLLHPVARPPHGADTMPDPTLTLGQQLTYEQEGERLDPYHPTPESGVTVGVGYDMKERSAAGIAADMVGVGVAKETAEAFGKAAKLSGAAADVFVRDNPKLAITKAQSQGLFVGIYAAKEEYTRTLATKADVTTKYGVTDWYKLDGRIRDVLIDMTFRGDYTGAVREKVQEFVVKNDKEGFKKAISVKTNFPGNLSNRRFQARIDHL